MDELHIGEVYATQGVIAEMKDIYGFQEFCSGCLMRHRSYDWGDIDEEDKASNDEAVESGGRIISAYILPRYFCIAYTDRIWIITEADRSQTTILFPYEY